MGLISVEEGREYLPGVGPGSDPAVGRLIERVSSSIAAHLGYPSRTASLGPSIESYAYTLYSGIPGGCWVVDDGEALILPARPITSITSIYDDPDLLTYGAAYLVTSTDYTYDAHAGRIFLLPSRTHGAFSSRTRAVKVSVTAGWSVIPDPIREACIRTCQAWWVSRRTGAGAEAPRTGPEGSYLPREARELLAPYRVAHGWVA